MVIEQRAALEMSYQQDYLEVESEDGGVPLLQNEYAGVDIEIGEASSPSPEIENGGPTALPDPLGLNSASPFVSSDPGQPPGSLASMDPFNELAFPSALFQAPAQGATLEEDWNFELPFPPQESALVEVSDPHGSAINSGSFGLAPPPTVAQTVESGQYEVSLGLSQSIGAGNYEELEGEAAYIDSNLHYSNTHNLCIDGFLEVWERAYLQLLNFPKVTNVANDPRRTRRPSKISAPDLETEDGDIQGIDWSAFSTTRADARKVRKMTYKNPRNCGPQVTASQFEKPYTKASFGSRIATVSSIDRYFRFRETSTTFKTHIAHFQLRHNICASSKNAVFCNTPTREYGFRPNVSCINPEAGTKEIAINLSKVTNKEAPRMHTITTLTASDGVLVVGGQEGVYAIKSLSATYESEHITGTITNDTDSSTNHVHVALDRQSGLPKAVFASNDHHIRILDCCTNKFVGAHEFASQVNCSATSPDGRLRLLVKDDKFPVVADAATGRSIATLYGHDDHGFACAWAPDGITMATGHQDGIARIWDVRRLKSSIQSLPAEMAGVRAMEFSPLGAGRPVLVMAEPGDFVSIIDAKTFERQQQIEFFGEIAGISMPPDGSKLYIANQDPRFGGLMVFDRTGNGSSYKSSNRRNRFIDEYEMMMANAERAPLSLVDLSNDIDDDDLATEDLAEIKDDRKRAGYTDWRSESDVDDDERAMHTRPHRWRQGMGLGDMVF